MAGERARRAYARIQFEGAEITEEPECSLLSMTFTDAEDGKTDDLQFVLEDRDLIWAGNWLEQATASRGAKVEAQIWLEEHGETSVLPCGVFEVDSVGLSGTPTRVTIRATSLPYKSGIREEKKSKSWEQYSLSGIGAEIAAGGGMELQYMAEEDPFYETREQVEQSDTVFLLSLVWDAGLKMKISQNKIIIYDRPYYESQEAVCTLYRDGSDLISYSFDSDTFSAAYSKCVCRYVNPETGDVIEGTYTPEDSETEMPELVIDVKAENAAEAEANAKAAYENALKNKYTCELTLVGDPMYMVGMNIQLEGFGAFSGTYAIASARHAISGNYVTTVSGYRI